ncbi:MAG: DNA modification methylase [Sphingomicrobium sp.]
MRERVPGPSASPRRASAQAGVLLLEGPVVEKKKLRGSQLKAQNLSKTRGRRRSLDAKKRIADERERPRRNDLLPKLEVALRAIESLERSPHRTRDTEPVHVERLMKSIRQLGFNQPILVAGNEIIDGDVRAEAASQLGLTSVPVIDCSHLSPTEVRQLRLAANRTAELGTWNLEKLKAEFETLVDLGADLEVTGFTSEERDIVLLDEIELGELDDDDEDPGSVPENPVTRQGDLWLMEGHRVICGNALEAEVYEVLLAGIQAHLLLCDPPYNVTINGNVSKTHDEFVMASGEMSDDEFQEFLNRFLRLAAANLVAGSVLFVFMDWRSIHRVYQAGFGAGLRLINMAVWYKESGAMGALYRSAHELVAVFCKGDKPHTNNVELGRNGRDRQNVWVAPGANRRGSSANEMLALHATPKPVELCVDAILDVTKPGQTVLDPFLGSGTTLIAAEKTGRRCCGIELDPKFVDVSVHRWMRLTDKEAVLEASGETFTQVAERRAAEAAGEQS